MFDKAFPHTGLARYERYSFTKLYHYRRAARRHYCALQDHLSTSQDYMSPIKEPMFFAFTPDPYYFEPGMAAIFRRTVRNRREYLLLFAAVTHQRAIGEASNIYLRTPCAAYRIQQTLPRCRLIAVLRNPVERAYSHYSYMARLGLDRAPDFGEALRLEYTDTENRTYFSCIQKWDITRHTLQVYYGLFPREQIRIYLCEDWNNTPRAMLGDLFGFLNVDATVMPGAAKIHSAI